MTRQVNRFVSWSVKSVISTLVLSLSLFFRLSSSLRLLPVSFFAFSFFPRLSTSSLFPSSLSRVFERSLETNCRRSAHESSGHCAARTISPVLNSTQRESVELWMKFKAVLLHSARSAEQKTRRAKPVSRRLLIRSVILFFFFVATTLSA